MAKARHKTVFDTGQQYLASVYAKALLGATEKAGNTESVLESLESLVGDVLEAIPSLELLLSSPRIPWDAKLRTLDAAFRDKASAQLLNFLKVVTQRGRFNCLRAIAQSYRHQFNELHRRVEVTVTSAEELDQESVQHVADGLRQQLGSEVDLHLRVDSELIGGLVVRVGDTVFDGSLSNRLRKLRNDMVSKVTHEIRTNLDRFAVAE